MALMQVDARLVQLLVESIDHLKTIHTVDDATKEAWLKVIDSTVEAATEKLAEHHASEALNNIGGDSPDHMGYSGQSFI